LINRVSDSERGRLKRLAYLATLKNVVHKLEHVYDRYENERCMILTENDKIKARLNIMESIRVAEMECLRRKEVRLARKCIFCLFYAIDKDKFYKVKWSE
jgi:hypothetical protein